jgi:hypothetical protein
MALLAHPMPDADFSAFYVNVAESLADLGRVPDLLRHSAQLVQSGYAAGRVTAHSIDAISNDCAGRVRLTGLVDHLMGDLISRAGERAKDIFRAADVDESLLSECGDSLELHMGIEEDTGDILMSQAMNFSLLDCTRALAEIESKEVRALLMRSLTAMTHCGSIAAVADLYRSSDSMECHYGSLYALADQYMDVLEPLFEGWTYSADRPDSYEEALSHLETACDESDDEAISMDDAGLREAFRNSWLACHGDPELEATANSRLDMESLANDARALAETAPGIARYAADVACTASQIAMLKDEGDEGDYQPELPCYPIILLLFDDVCSAWVEPMCQGVMEGDERQDICWDMPQTPDHWAQLETQLAAMLAQALLTALCVRRAGL